MMTTKPKSVRRRTLSLPSLALLFVLTLVGAVLPVQVSSAHHPTAPTALAVTMSTDTSGFGDAQGVPEVLAAAGQPITLTVTLQPAGATFTSDTDFDLDACIGAADDTCAPAPGHLSAQSITIPAGQTSGTDTVSYSRPDNGVRVSVTPSLHTGQTAGFPTGYSNAFDSLITVLTAPSTDPTLATGFGAGSCDRHSTAPVCGYVVLPQQVASEQVGLSTGACTGIAACSPGSQVVQFVGTLGNNYTTHTPATIVMRCDKSVCRGGGVPHYTIKLSFDPSGPLDIVAPACLRKGVAEGIDAAGNRTDYCVDYRQSHRNAGDLLLYVLTTRDYRGTY
ncbi:MAG: hypothetical protein L0H79_13840 [Intrasporangium sp.]|uniref:hypothetical protein n=1 Tax=Intrasporangium sp. TaxID=1925024 RepID=UPI002647F4EC|nr:hypothetical protein [Intrasporangium sp.]MDN5796821.1 hypothetical protein [Intrasporangium sp.]